jgi:hypothetical protein
MAEVPPVDLSLLARQGGQAQVGFGVGPRTMQRNQMTKVVPASRPPPCFVGACR